MTQVVVIENRSQYVAASSVAGWLPSLTVYLNEHVRSFWTDAPVFELTVGTPTAGTWPAYLEDGSTQPDLGYHDVETGYPTIHVDVTLCMQYNIAVTDAFSHELAEAAADPQCTRFVDGAWGRALAEICDPFVLPQYTYAIDGVTVANFVSPAFYGLGASPRLDMKGVLQPGQVFPYLPEGGCAMVAAPGQRFALTSSPAMLPPGLLQLALARREASRRCRYMSQSAAPQGQMRTA